MPNFTYNTLFVTGDRKNLQHFKRAVRTSTSDLCLSALLPMPNALKDTDAEDDGPNWYDWRIENWGTKWDASGKLVAESEVSLEYSFRTAWNPPLEWLEKVSRDYASLVFRLRYVEESDDFTGIARVQNGHVEDSRLNHTDLEAATIPTHHSMAELAADVFDACAMIIRRASSLLPEGR